MWWQILPPTAVVAGCIGGIFIAMPVVQYAFTGRPTLRGLQEHSYMDDQLYTGYRRDFTMNGNEYESKGLDNLPDED